MRPQTLALWLSGGVPFVAYVLTASGFAYWLDSGEFVAAAVQLDIAHPPGHPLSALFGRALCMLPLGSLSFRVALGQALASAGASALCCRATLAAISGMRLPEPIALGCGVLAAWLSAFAYGVWFQAVRPEVYALQTLCVACAFERLLALQQPRDSRALIGAAFALGLGLANHHLIAFLIAPACLPGLILCLRARRFRSAACAFGFGAMALCTYAYLPLRAAAGPPADLGDPRTLERLAWVVSARVYAHDMGSEAVQPLATRAVDVLALFYEDYRVLPLALALLGAYLMCRMRQTRRAAVVVLCVLGVDAGARAWLGPVRANPDILGYLGPSYLAIATLAAGCVAAFAWVALRSWPARGGALALVYRGLPLCALLLVPGNAARASLGSFHATDVLDDPRWRALPPRAVLVESTPQTAFRSWEVEAVERVRPDLLQLPLPFLRYPGMQAAIAHRAPVLSELVSSYLAHHDRVQLDALRALSRTRPVFVEMDTRVPSDAYAWLRPRGLLAEVASEPRSGAALEPRALQVRFERTFDALAQELGADAHETESARQLLWIHYMNALHLDALGLRGLARAEVARARSLHPQDARLRALEHALAGTRPLELQAFLRFP